MVKKKTGKVKDTAKKPGKKLAKKPVKKVKEKKFLNNFSYQYACIV